MANLRDFSSSSLSQLLGDSINDIPGINIRSDSAELRSSVDTLRGILYNHLSTSTDSKNTSLSDKEILSRVAAAYDQIKKDEKYSKLFENLNSTSSKLGELILRSFGTLKYDIHPEVESLKLSFQARVQEIVDIQKRKRAMMSEVEDTPEGEYDNENFEELDDEDIQDVVGQEADTYMAQPDKQADDAPEIGMKDGLAEDDSIDDTDIFDKVTSDPSFDEEIDHASDEAAEQIADDTEKFVDDVKESFGEDEVSDNNEAGEESADIMQGNKDTQSASSVGMDDTMESMCLFEWDKLFNRFGGINTITDMYKDITGYKSGGNFSDTTLALNMTKPHVEKIILHPELETEIHNTLSRESKNEVDREYLTRLFRICTDQYEFDKFFDRHLYQAETTSNPARLLQINSKALSRVYPYLTKLSKISFNISEELSDKIHQNIKVVENMFWIMANQVLAFRKHYSNALVISHNLINSDTYNEYRHNGGTNRDITNHLKVHFRNRNIYSSGLSSEDIISNKVRNANLLKDMKKQISARKKEIKNRLYFAALKDTLYNHLRATPPDKLPEGMSLDNYIDLRSKLIDSTLDKYVASATPNIEQLLYRFVLGLGYEGTVIEKTHELFNSSLSKQLSLKNKITKEDLKMVDVEVGAKIASEFIAKNIFQY